MNSNINVTRTIYIRNLEEDMTILSIIRSRKYGRLDADEKSWYSKYTIPKDVNGKYVVYLRASTVGDLIELKRFDSHYEAKGYCESQCEIYAEDFDECDPRILIPLHFDDVLHLLVYDGKKMKSYHMGD